MEEGGWYTQWGEASSLSIGEGLTFEGYACSGVGNGVLIDADDGNNNPHRAFKQVPKATCMWHLCFVRSLFTRKVIS